MKGTVKDIRVNLDDRFDTMWSWDERQQNKSLIRTAAFEIAKHAGYKFHAKNMRVGLNLAETGKSHDDLCETVFFHIEWATSGGCTKRSNRYCRVLRANGVKKNGGYNYHSYHGWLDVQRRIKNNTLHEIVRKPKRQ